MRSFVRPIAFGAAFALATSMPAAIASTPGVPTPAPVAEREPGFVPGDVLVRFSPRVAPARAARLLDRIGGRIEASIDNLGVHRVVVADVAVALRALRRARIVEFAERNRIGRIASELLPNDRCFGGGCGIGRLWNLDAINAPAGWAIHPGSFYTAATKAALPAPVKIAVLDTKLDLDRFDWRNQSPGSTGAPHDARNGGQLAIADAADFVTNGAHDGPAAYHGTFITGLLAASANNTTDVAGVAYHANVVPVAVVDGTGKVTAFDLARGIDHAVDVGARIVNLSLGMTGPDRAVELAIQRAAQRQVVLVAAAGNHGNDRPFYPAFYPGVMSVTASTAADRPAQCTNHSSKTSVAAPGAGIIGLDPRATGGLSLVTCGTSTAAPHVAGLAALLLGQQPGRTALDVRRIIESTADDDALRLGRDDFFGAGRINVERALRFGEPVPNVERLTISIPPNDGGDATANATATATASTTILGGEWFLDRLGAPGTGRPMAASDGAFDETEEAMRATISTTLQQSAGAYRVFVRARNANGWGPATTGALVVDRTPPVVAIDRTVPPTASAIAGMPATIAATIADDHGLTARVSYEVRDAILGSVVASSSPVSASFGDTIAVTWQPAVGMIGLYDLTLSVQDEAGNTGRASVRVFASA